MRSKSMILMALAIGCGLVAALGISQVMDAHNKAGDQTDKQAVFVAMVDISANEELTAQNIKLEEWPKNIVPQGALTKLEEVEGKKTRIKLYAGEPILSSKLVGAADAVGAAKDIPDGYRVSQVKVDSVSGASNLILPGDRVDVLVFRTPPSSDQNATAAKIVLQDIKVFAVDTHTETEFSRNKSESGEPISAKSISLLVTPQQSLILHAASEMGGSLRLVLRNPDDDVHVTAHAATIADIFGPDQPSDRGREHGDKTGDKEDEKGDMADWLEKQKERQTVVQAPPSVERVASPTRQMTVIMGGTVRQVELPGDGTPPVDQPSGGSGGFGSDPSTPMAPPVEAPLAPPPETSPTETPAPPAAQLPPAAPNVPPQQTAPSTNGN